MAFDEAFDEDPLDQDALQVQLGGAPPPPQTLTAEQLAALRALLAKAQLPTTPTSRQVGESVKPAEPFVGPRQPSQMRAATPEERVVTRLEDEGDPQAVLARAHFQMQGPKPPPGPTSMRAANTGERLRDLRSDIWTALQPAWMNAREARDTTVPEPSFPQIDPTMGSAGPTQVAGTVAKEGAEAVGDVLGKVLKSKKTPKAPKVKPPPPFEFAPVDATAKARMTMLGQDAPIQYRQLPPGARPTALSKTLTTPPATPDAGVGVTINPATGQMVVGGQPGPVMAGKFPNSSARTIGPIPVGQFTPQHIKDFYDANRDVFSKDPKAFLGGWLDKKTNSIYLDVSKGFKDVRKATKFAEEQNPGTVQGKMKGKPTGIVRDPVTGKWPQAQKNLFDPETFAEPPVGNDYEFLTGMVRDAQGNTFKERLDEMAQRGEKAMGGEDPEWWDLRKTARNPNAPIPRVYGEENVKPMAGYTATMSPQNDPYNDLQMATEYQRRHIKGEPVVQPDWVAPPTAMGPQGDKGGFSPSPGMKFPNEDFYAINANKVREGRYEELTQDKVNDMYHALVGEDVGVLDRHFAKIGEDPASGIYSADEPNVMTPSMTSGKLDNYATMYNQVRDAAIAAGKPMKQYSAYVWEGIRDTIRKTGDLFGQKHRATAVPDTTTGFNEIFEDLLQRKAQHLGITTTKLEELLRSGDAELLGTILATPVGIAAYQKWSAEQPPSQKGGGV